MKARVVAVLFIIAAAAAPAAQAAPWKRVTTPDGSSSDQAGLARTPDGVLHVVWHHPTGPNTADLLHTVISPAGDVGATTPVQSGWTGFTNPALVVEPGGLRAFWGGIRTTDPNDPQNETNTALSPDRGTTWTLQPGPVVPPGAQSYASNTSATVRFDGSTLQAFAGTLGTWTHAGLSPAAPIHDFQAALGPYGHDPNLATDASDRSILAWFSSATGHLGVQAQDVAADGAPIGSPVTMPGTSNMQLGMLARTPLAARVGGGFYVAYATGSPTANRVRLWRVGASAAPMVGRVDNSRAPAVAIAAAEDGRLWVVWTEGFGDPDVFARRSNASATEFGEIVEAGHPREALQAYSIDASAAGGALDVLGNFNIDTSSAAATSFARVLPGLTLDADPGRLRKARETTVRFTVSDAGDPVKDVRVRAGGLSGRTNARGNLVLTIRSRRPVTASATRSGYTRATKPLELIDGG
jgi:hypothetical protein